MHVALEVVVDDGSRDLVRFGTSLAQSRATFETQRNAALRADIAFIVFLAALRPVNILRATTCIDPYALLALAARRISHTHFPSPLP